MTGSSATVQPITVEQLREIMEGLGDQYKGPPDDELAVLAATLTGMQSHNFDPDQEWDHDFDVEDARRGHTSVPFWLRRTFDADRREIGHPRYVKTTWHDLAPDMVAAFLKAMGPMNPRYSFGKRFAVARFLEEVIPLITGETPSTSTIGQWLIQPHQRKRARKRIR